LKKNVGVALAEGLADTIAQGPPDAVDYLGKWLLNYVRLQKESKVKQAADEKAKADWKPYAAQEEKAMKVCSEKEQLEDAKKAKEEAYTKFLEGVKDRSELLDRFCVFLGESIGVDSVYVGEKQERPAGEATEEIVSYVASTASQRFMLGRILKKDQGTTFNILAKPEDAGDEGEEKKVKEAPVMCIQNVMVGPDAKKTFFFKGANTGAYFATALEYKAFDSFENFTAALPAIEEIKKAAEEKQKEIDEKKEELEKKMKEIEDELAKLDEADNPKKEEDKKEEGEEARKEEAEEKKEEPVDEAKLKEEKEARDKRRQELNTEKEALAKETENQEQVPDWKTEVFTKVEAKARDMVVCLDTLGSFKQFSAPMLDKIKSSCKDLLPVLEQCDKAMFLVGLERHFALIKLAEECKVDAPEFKRQREETKKELDEELTKVLEDGGKGYKQEGFKYTDEDVLFHLAKKKVVALADNVLALSKYSFFKTEHLNVVQALLLLIGKSKTELSYMDGSISLHKIQMLINDKLIEEIKNYNPRDLEEAHKEIAKVETLIGELKQEDLKAENFIISEIFSLVKPALTIRKTVEEVIAKKKAEEEAAKKAEEEAAKKAEEEKKEDS